MADPVAAVNQINPVPYYQTQPLTTVDESAGLPDLYAAILDAEQYNSPLTTLPDGAPDNTYLLNLSPDTFNTLTAANDTGPAITSADEGIQLSLLQDLNNAAPANAVGLTATQDAVAQYEQTALNADLYDTTLASAGLSTNNLPITELSLTDTLDALPPQDTLQAIINTVTPNGNPAPPAPQTATSAAQAAVIEAEIAAQNAEQTLAVLAEGSLIDLVS